MPRRQIRAGVAGVLDLYPPATPDGAASVTVYDADGRELVAETPAVLSGVQAELTLAAQVSVSALAVDDAAGIVPGRRYHLATGTGWGMSVRVVDVPSSTLVEIDQPLTRDLEAGATLTDHRLTVALSAAVTAEIKRSCRAEWSFSIGGDVRYVTQMFDIVRWPFRPTVTLDDIERHDSDWRHQVTGDGAWQRLVDGAIDDVERRLRAQQMAPDLVRERDALLDAIVLRLIYKALVTSPGDVTPDQIREARLLADQAFSEAVQAPKAYDADDSGTIEQEEELAPPVYMTVV